MGFTGLGKYSVKYILLQSEQFKLHKARRINNFNFAVYNLRFALNIQ